MKREVNQNRTKNILRNICISTIILFVGIIVILKSFKVEQGLQNLLYSYNINRNANYTVYLKENTFFETATLEMNKTYVSNLVDKINMDFTYSMSGNKKAKTILNWMPNRTLEESIKTAYKWEKELQGSIK